MAKTLIGISMIKEPYFKEFYKNEIFNLAGLLVGAIYDDYTTGLVLFPYIEKPEITKDGTYRVRIYDSKEKNFEVDWYVNVYDY